MRPNQRKYNYLFSSLIWIGLLTFVLFFFLGSVKYPGGSNVNPNSAGFNWSTNYWSELLGYNAKNGERNDARPYGISGAICLAISMSIFWLFIPRKLNITGFARQTIQWAGPLSMVSSVLIFGDGHDAFITLSVTFGSIAFLLTLVGLWNNKQLLLFWWCTLCLLLIILNTVIYLTEWKISILPILQKMTFASGIGWVSITTSLLSFQDAKESWQKK